MAIGKISPKDAISFTKLSIAMTFSWPLSPIVNRSEAFVFKTLQIVSIVSSLMLLLPLLNAIYTHYYDIVILSKSICFALPISYISLDGIHYHIHESRLQFLVTEMESFCKQAKSHEKDILQRYVDKNIRFYGLCTCWFYLTACTVIIGPLLLAQPFPTDAVYPFSVEYQPLKCIIFIHQSIVGVQMAAKVCMMNFVALMIWYITARLEMLSVDFQMTRNIYEFVDCVKKHKKLLRYAQIVTTVIRFHIFIAITVSVISTTFAGIIFITNSSLLVKAQFVAVLFTGLIGVFMCAWPADHLMDMSIYVAQGVYNSLWYNKLANIQKYVPFVLLNCQRPISVTTGFFLPVITLNYYISYLSTIFSYFTALRVMVKADVSS